VSFTPSDQVIASEFQLLFCCFRDLFGIRGRSDRLIGGVEIIQELDQLFVGLLTRFGNGMFTVSVLRVNVCFHESGVPERKNDK
jgi:hypothetical protein